MAGRPARNRILGIAVQHRQEQISDCKMRFWQRSFRFLTVFLLGIAVLAVPARAGPSLLFDVGSGKVLAHEDAFKRWYPASLTKLMTAYVAFRAVQAGELQLDSPVRVSENSAKEPPSKMGYTPGSEMTLDNALKMIMVKSANDIATAIGESVGGSEQAFAARMNAEAARLGMVDTHFVNANGLHATQQYTTARDLAVLVWAIRREFPQHAHYFSIEGISAGDKVMRNYNLLIGRFEGADGMKTGYICASGFNLIATATRKGRTLAAIVLGAASQVERAERAAALLVRGFASPGFAAPTLASLKPSGTETKVATDMRPEICSKEAREARAENRDDEGRLILESAHVQPINREPKIVSVGLGGVTGPASSVPRYADVPIPTPRPDYPPPAKASAATAEGG